MSSLPIRRVIFRIQQGCHPSEVLVVGGPSPEKLSLVYTMEGSDLYQSLASSIYCDFAKISDYSHHLFKRHATE